MEETPLLNKLYGHEKRQLHFTYPLLVMALLGLALIPFHAYATANSKNTLKATASFQQMKITGTVVDDAGTPLPGASIVEKGTTNGTQTDFDGSFVLDLTRDDSVLLITYIGYESQEIPVNGQSAIKIQLKASESQLDEVVVIGYGTVSNRKVTTAVSRVSGTEVADLPVTSIDQALQGRASGVYIANSGSPGTNPTVRIRGLGSALNSDPLFVVDGIPVGQGAMNDIPPDNIENITILKDAASTAIYGSRGANGVILITTKKGKVGKGKLTFSSYYGIQNIPKSTQYDLLNTDQYINFAQNSFGVSAPRFNDYDFNARSFRPGSPSEELIGVETDWQDALFEAGPIQDYYVNYSGGSENLTYNVGGGYFDQNGALVNTYFKRASFNANFEGKVGDRFKIGNSIILSRSSRNDPNDTTINGAIQMMPYLPVRDPSRQGGFRASDFADNADPFQPVLLQELIQDEGTFTKLFATAYAQYELFDGLNIKLAGGIENNFTQTQRFRPLYNAGEVAFNQNPNPDFIRSNTIFLSPILTTTLNYNKTFGKHGISAVGGYEAQRFNTETIVAEATFLPNQNVLNPANSPIDRQRSAVVVQKTGINSLFARVDYDYDGKYLLGGSVRRDQSSVFAPENNVGIFPAVSAGWRLSDEGFFKGLKSVVSDFKIRGSWGKNGNTAVGAYTWDPVIFANQVYVLGDDQSLEQGLVTNQLFNRDLQWESVIKTNIGFDAELFDGKAYLNFEWFNNRSEDLIIPVPIPSSTGLDISSLGNVGEVENRGLEFSFGYSEQKTEFKWSLDANVSFIQNEVTSLGAGENANLSGPNFQNTASPATRAEVGEPIGFYYGWKVDRIYQNQAEIDADNAQAVSLSGDASATRQGGIIAPGDIRFQDLNGDGVINGEDRTNLGHYLPDINVGLNAMFNYKNFDMTANFIGAFGFELLHANRYYTEGMTRLFNMGTEVLNAWTPTNTDTNIPRASFEGSTSNARMSDRWVEKGDFVRLKTLTLGYTLPQFSNSPFSKLRIYGQATNLLTFTGYTGYDPEVQGRPGGGTSNALFYNGVDASSIPTPRTFILGFDIAF